MIDILSIYQIDLDILLFLISECNLGFMNLFLKIFTDFFLPPIRSRGYHSGDIFSFVPCINFPMKQVYLNPFPSPLDQRDAMFGHPLSITLKSSQKLFIPSQSYVPFEEDSVAWSIVCKMSLFFVFFNFKKHIKTQDRTSMKIFCDDNHLLHCINRWECRNLEKELISFRTSSNYNVESSNQPFSFWNPKKQ